MTPTDSSTAGVNHRARAQALFDAVLRTHADIPAGVRIHCAVAVGVLGERFADVAAARAAADAVFDLDPAGGGLDPAGVGIETALRAGLQELGKLPAEQFRQVFRAAEAGHDALAVLR